MTLARTLNRSSLRASAMRRTTSQPPHANTRQQPPTHRISASSSLVDEPDDRPHILRFPGVWTDPEHRTVNPVLPPVLQAPLAPQTPPRTRRQSDQPASGQQQFWATPVDDRVRQFASSLTTDEPALVVPPQQREWIRQHLSLRDFYQDWIAPDMDRRVAKGAISKGTVQKDRQALARWEEHSPRPGDWPADEVWPGVPLGAITGRVIERTLERLAEAVCPGTFASTWSHLRNILNQAVRLRAIEVFPRPQCIPQLPDPRVQLYTEQQLAAAYIALASQPDLQVALVLTANAGLRCEDVFLLRVDNLDLEEARPAVEWTAQKTGKRQRVPLAPVTVAHLRRLDLTGSHLFPGRSSPEAIDPERSKPARRRRDTITRLYAAAGLKFTKPWQALRATCNKRLEDVRSGVGQFVLGHACTLNSRHYYEPSDLIAETVCQVRQPPVFLEVFR